MRIAMVSEHASPLAVLGGTDAGGQNVYVAALGQQLARRGHDVVVHTRRADPHVDRRLPFAPGVTVDHVDAGPPRAIPKDDIWPHVGAFADDLRARWSEERPDVVHANFWMSGVAALAAAHDLGLPVVQTFHALGEVKRRHQGAADTSPADRCAAERSIVARADHVVATCSDEAFELRQLGADMSRVTIAPCGVDLDVFTPTGPALERGPRPTHRVVCVSRLVPRKGVDDAIRALAQVPDTELLVAGGPARDHLDEDAEVARLRRVAEDAGVADRVTFLGSLERDQVPRLLRSADVLVASPWYEPFGIVPLEAMATGTPVVATAVGGMIDTVADGVTGVHVPPRDPDAIAEALRTLLGDDRCRERLGRAGLARVRTRYTWDRVADGIEDVYERTVARAALDGAGRYVSDPATDGASANGVAADGGAEPSRVAVRTVHRLPTPTEHVHALVETLGRLRPDLGRLERWGQDLASCLHAGGRLLACGNGGSAADAQHLTAELVGRYRDDRAPYSALALHADTSSLTAIANDYGYDEVFARQVRAHGRPGDVLVAFSTSGTSRNVLAAAAAAAERGLTVWAMTGAGPNPLADAADDAVTVDAEATATVQEVHGVLVHALCAAVDRALLVDTTLDPTSLGVARAAHASGARRRVGR